MISAILLVAGGLTIHLPEQKEVRGTELWLGSVATVQGQDVDLVARARDLSLGHVPAPGYSRLLRREQIAAELARALPGVQVTVEGALRCRVYPAVVTVTAASLREEARGALAAVFRDADVQLNPSGSLADLAVPQARGSFSLQARPNGQTPAPGSWSVPVEVLIDGEVYRTVWTSWSVALWERRMVLRRDVASGETLQASDFETKRVAVANGPRRIALDPAAFGQATARRALSKGSVVTEHDVERKVIIQQGELVSVEVKRGGVTVRALAVAEQNARAGDRIRIRLERTGKRLVAVVRGPELVEVLLK